MTRREWATMLGSVCSPSFPADAIEALVDMLPLLSDYADEVFCAETVKRIARSKRRQACPDLGEVSAVLTEFRRELLPVYIRMGGAPDTPRIEHQRVEPTEAECQRVSDLAAAFKAEIDARQMVDRPKAEPRYLSKLELALSIPRHLAEQRPDLKAALDEYQISQGVKA